MKKLIIRIRHALFVFFICILMFLPYGDYTDNQVRIPAFAMEDDGQIRAKEEKQPELTEYSGENNEKNSLPVQKKLDFLSLEGVDEAKHGWGVVLNSRHKTPGISQQERNILDRYGASYTGDTSSVKVYLIFSASYENGNTPKVLDALKENNTKAAFFLVGTYVRDNPGIVKRMLDEGHQIGNHSLSHQCLPLIGNEELEKEMAGYHNEFQTGFGTEFRYFMPPSGEYSEKVLAAANQLGYRTIFWSFAYPDYDGSIRRGADYAFNIVMNNLHNGAFIFLHTVSADNADAMDRIVKGIKEAGYSISEMDM